MQRRLASLPLRATAFSSQPFTFLDPPVHEDLAAIVEIDLIENGDRAAREHWQKRQLDNLLKHTIAKSGFWRQRIPSRHADHKALNSISIQTRTDLMQQVMAEGSLVDVPPGAAQQTYASSGSTGTPVQVYLCPQNGRYNAIFSLARYFIEGLRVDEPRTFIKPADGNLMLDPAHRIKVERFDNWIGGFDRVFTGGAHKLIHFTHDEDALVEELLKDRVGYLACLGSHVDILLKKGGIDLIRRLGITMWLHHSDNQDDVRSSALKEAGVPIRSSYSCSEVGPIASECGETPGFYHVANSNVVVDTDKTDAATMNGAVLGRVLLTHLHSYATPIIRYDVGDLAVLDDTCPCGHDGPTLSNIRGRRKFFLRHPDGHLLPFYIFSKPLLDIVAFSEFFVHQPDAATIVIELGGHDSLSPEEEAKVRNFILRASDPAFQVVVRPVKSIDWSKNPKRLTFLSAVA